MGISVGWDDETQSVVRMSFTGAWSLADFRLATLQTAALVRTVEHRAYVIADMRESGDIPLGILWQLRDLAGGRPKNWGGGIALTRSVIARNVVDILGHIYMGQQHQRLFVVAVQKEADVIIARWKEQDQGL